MRATISSWRIAHVLRELSATRLIAWIFLLFGMVPRAWSSAVATATAKGSGWRIAAICAAGALAGLIYGVCRRYVFRYLRKRTATASEPPPDTSGVADVCGQISIYREAAHADRLRAYVVLLDGRAVGEILPDENRTFVLSEGKHVVTIKIDWAGSNSLVVDVSRRSLQRLRVRSNLTGLRVILAPWYALFLRKSYLRLEPYQSNV